MTFMTTIAERESLEARERGITICFTEDEALFPKVIDTLKESPGVAIVEARPWLEILPSEIFIIDVGRGSQGLLKESGIREKPHNNLKSPLFNGYRHNKKSKR